MTILHELEARLRDQGLEVAKLRATVDMQFTRIAERQTELDSQLRARGRRHSRRAVAALTSHHGHGNSHRH